MTENEVKAHAFAMLLTSPAFARPRYRFVNREYLIVTYCTDPAAPRAVIPAPLEMAEPVVKYEFIRMPDSTALLSPRHEHIQEVVPAVVFQGA